MLKYYLINNSHDCFLCCFVSRFIQRFLESDTLIVVGETGCGKSTQIPQYLFKDCPQFFSYRGLAITQVRISL